MILGIGLSRKRTLWIGWVSRSSCRSSNSISHELRSLPHSSMRTAITCFRCRSYALRRENVEDLDYKCGHGSVDRTVLSARKRDRKWKEEWTGIRTGESRPRTRGVKGRKKGGKGKFRLRGMGKDASDRSRWRPRQNRQRRTTHQK